MSKFVAVAMTALFILSGVAPATQPPLLSVSHTAATLAPDAVQFPSPQVEFIVGPQLRTGSALNPWPWFDSNATSAGHVLGKAFPASPPADQEHFAGYTNYYDQVLTQYINAYRAANESERQAFLGYARKSADSWWKSAAITEGRNRNWFGDVAGPTSAAPRMVSLGGLILRALDGRPEMWDWIAEYTKAHLSLYLMPIRLNDSSLQNGTRDPGFVLLHAAWVAKALPDSYPLEAGGTGNGIAVRQQLTAGVQRWVRNYWRRLQIKGTGTAKDGAWLWGGEANGYTYRNFEQPFHVGLLLEGLVAVHRLTGQAEAKDAILASVAHLYLDCFDTRPVTVHPLLGKGDPNIKARWMAYFRYGSAVAADGTVTTTYDAWPGGGVDLSSGWPNGVKEARELNSTVMHAFGYAYFITGDPKYRTWGDDVFSASFGNNQGPGADGLTDLAYLIGDGTNAKSYNQNYRAAGRYLVWRLGSTIPTPTPTPLPAPTPTRPTKAKHSPVGDSMVAETGLATPNDEFSIRLSNPTSTTLGPHDTATLIIHDNAAKEGPNPIDETQFFVRQHYLDFLHREPDPKGDANWQALLNGCAQGDTSCDRVHVSSSFFRSSEFQSRGYFIYRFYPVSLGRKPNYDEFATDLAKVSGFLSDADLEAAKVQFIAEFMNRPVFVTTFGGLSNSEYVSTLLATVGITHPNDDSWIAALDNGTKTRAQVLREVTETTEVYSKYYNQSFVVMQYFGYLRRDPDALYSDWIRLLEETGDYRMMTNGFVNSKEYVIRFGPSPWDY